MKRVVLILFLGLVYLAVASCDPGSKRIMLRFKHSEGQHLTYSQIMKGSVVIVTGDSVTDDYADDLRMTVHHKVTRIVDDSIGVVALWCFGKDKTYNNLDSTTTDTTFVIDTLILYITPTGRVTEVEMTQGHSQELVDYYRAMYDQWKPTFPEHEISQGHQWTQSFKIQLENEITDASTTYRLKAFAREQGYDCAVIEYSGNLVVPMRASPKDSLTLAGGVDRTAIKGVLYFAYRDGLTVSQKERWIRDGDYRVIQDGVEISQKLTIQYDIDITVLNPPGVQSVDVNP